MSWGWTQLCRIPRAEQVQREGLVPVPSLQPAVCALLSQLGSLTPLTCQHANEGLIHHVAPGFTNCTQGSRGEGRCTTLGFVVEGHNEQEALQRA